MKPPHPGAGAATPLSSASLLRLHSETIIGPAWNITMSLSVNATFQPSCSENAAGLRDIFDAEREDIESLFHAANLGATSGCGL